MERAEIRQLAPPSGRRDTLLETLEILHASVPHPQIVEVGTARRLQSTEMIDAGWATRVFAWYAAVTGGRLTTIDLDRRAIAASKTLCAQWRTSVEWIQLRAELVMGRFRHIDLLYMDGPSNAKVHWDVWQALTCRPVLVLWDDIITPGHPVPGAPPQRHYKQWPPAGVQPPYAVKGALVIPHMLTLGYRIVFARDRQVLLSRDS